MVPELIDQFLFAVVVAAHGHGNFDMRTQFHQADLADLRESAVATATAAPAKVRVVSRRVRHVQDSAVDAHQAQIVIEGAGVCGVASGLTTRSKTRRTGITPKRCCASHRLLREGVLSPGRMRRAV